MYSLKNFDKENFSNLKDYMLYTINNSSYHKDSIFSNNSNNSIDISKKSEIKSKQPNQFVDYNKMKSKYNEKNINNIQKNLLSDKLFWCYYKLINNYVDKDIENINSFSIEKEEKIKLVEKIRNSKELFKKYKIRKNIVEGEILNDKSISLYTFQALCMLNNLNVIVIKDNNTYTYFNYKNLEDTTINLKNYNAIKLTYNNSSSISKNFTISMEVSDNDIQEVLNKFYFVQDLDKPIKSISSYKANELSEIATKLNINIYSNNSKIKTKKELYENIIKILS
tara:strand:- start:2346 stop:3188 length:843 start_codon:yes stop_codon:yes gene_type:complete